MGMGERVYSRRVNGETITPSQKAHSVPASAVGTGTAGDCLRVTGLLYLQSGIAYSPRILFNVKSRNNFHHFTIVSPPCHYFGHLRLMKMYVFLDFAIPLTEFFLITLGLCHCYRSDLSLKLNCVLVKGVRDSG